METLRNSLKISIIEIYLIMHKYIFHRIALLTTATLIFTNAFCGTNILVGKSASQDGSTFCTYSADSYYLYGELSFYPNADYSKYTMTDIYGWDTHKYQGKIEQAVIDGIYC